MLASAVVYTIMKKINGARFEIFMSIYKNWVENKIERSYTLSIIQLERCVIAFKFFFFFLTKKM